VGDDEDDELDSLLSSLELHTQLLPQSGSAQMKQAACRAVSFSMDGQRIYTGGSAGDLCAVDAERVCTFSDDQQKGLLWRVDGASEGNLTPMQVIHPFQQSPTLVTGDDEGGVRVWDERMLGKSSSGNSKLKRPHGCVLSWKENDDYISALEHSDDGHTLLATSADGRLSVFDMRMATSGTNTHQKPFRLSDDQGDELLSVRIMKNGKKVVCGTHEGVLAVFSWGTWGDVSDRFPGHPSSIDALLKVDEDTLLTGSSDGFIRVVQIHPDKLLGVLGDDHGGFPIEKLEFNSTRHVVGSVSHDSNVRLWDARVLDEGYNDDDETSKLKPPPAATVAPKRTDNESDDEWEDMDDDVEMADDSDSESDKDSDDSDDDEKAPTTNDKRADRLKTDNEKFFDDL
jgi:WD40 repeat protein